MTGTVELLPADKVCRRCGERKPAADFPRNRRRPDGLNQWCKPCNNAACAEWRAANREKSRANTRAWQAANPERKRIHAANWYQAHRDEAIQRVRKAKLRSLYGMTPADRDIMAEKQGQRCLICCQPRPLVIDHDHQTGRVRGLLCDPCNTGIARFGEEPETLRRAAQYLESP